MIQQILDLAFGRAFLPDSQDTLVALARRFARKPLVAVQMYKDGMEVCLVTYAGGQAKFDAPEFYAYSSGQGSEDGDATFLRNFAERYKAKDCLIQVATGYTAVLSSRTRRAETDEESILLMRDNPERLLGEPPAQGCRHSLAYHPTHSFAVVFAHKETEINAAVGLAARAGLGLARLQCGMSSLLIHVLAHHWTDIGTEAELLFVDRSSLFYLTASETGFGRPLFDVGLKEPALKQAITERVAKLKPLGKVILVDASGLGVAAMIQEKQGMTVIAPFKDEPQPMLRACCSDAPHLGYDLFPAERDVRPFASAKLRIVPFAFWGMAAAAIAVTAVNTVRETQAHKQSEGFKTQMKFFDDGRHQAETQIKDIEQKEKIASAMCDWLDVSPPTQRLVIRITKEIEAATNEAIAQHRSLAQVDSMSIILQEGQPQMRFVLVLIGDNSAANRVFQRVSALFAELGYSTVDLKQSLLPQGFRYEHLLNIPKPTSA